jgi:hypothetical protein
MSNFYNSLKINRMLTKVVTECIQKDIDTYIFNVFGYRCSLQKIDTYPSTIRTLNEFVYYGELFHKNPNTRTFPKGGSGTSCLGSNKITQPLQEHSQRECAHSKL